MVCVCVEGGGGGMEVCLVCEIVISKISPWVQGGCLEPP